MRAGRGPFRFLTRAGRPARVAAVLSVVVLAGAVLRDPGGGSGGEGAVPAARSAAGSAPDRPPSPLRPRPSSSEDGSGGAGSGVDERGDGATVEAPVRVPDAAVVRLLRPGDRVDVLAAPVGPPSVGGSSPGAPPVPARIVARGARVAAVPAPLPASAPEHGGPGGAVGSGAEAGALVVLSVSRSTAARIAGAAAHSRLVVTLC